MIPSQAIHLWLTADDQIMIAYPDGQQIPIPMHEPARIITILRSMRKAPEDAWLAQRKFVAAFTDDDIRNAGRERRQLEAKRAEEKAAKEKRARMKRIEKRDKLKAANELLAIIGL